MAQRKGPPAMECRGLDYFLFGNTFSGSRGAFRWRMEPRIPKEKADRDQAVLHLWYWWDGLCFEKCTPSAEADFPLTQEGLDQLKAWLTREAGEGPRPLT